MVGYDVGISFVYLWIPAFFWASLGGGRCVQDCMVIMYYEELLRCQLMVCEVHAVYVIGYGRGT
jgi:hypothetical protein